MMFRAEYDVPQSIFHCDNGAKLAILAESDLFAQELTYCKAPMLDRALDDTPHYCAHPSSSGQPEFVGILP